MSESLWSVYEPRYVSWCIGCKYVYLREARLWTTFPVAPSAAHFHIVCSTVGLLLVFNDVSANCCHSLRLWDAPSPSLSHSLSVVLRRIVKYLLILNVPGSPGNNEINDVLSLLLHVSHRVSIKERFTWPGLALCISNRKWCLFGCYNTLLLCWCCLVSFWFFSQSQEVGSCIAKCDSS